MTKPTINPVRQPAAKPGKRGPLRVLAARYVASVQQFAEVPAGPPEIAFVGRSNVGKSSLINALCGHKGLARTSKTPGRTQAINLFDADLSSGQQLRFIDLPGFGHAELSKQKIAGFSELIQFYLLQSTHLRLVLILQDARRDRDHDAVGFARWLQENNVACEPVATKADEIPSSQRDGVARRLQTDFSCARPILAVSARDNFGLEALLLRIRAAGYPMPAR